MSSQIIPISLKIRNFLSYGNNITHIPLNFEKPTLVIGRNLDHSSNGEIDSNGSGKSSIINAIAFALYGKTIGNKIKLDKLINWINGKNMEVGVHFSKNGKFYYVERFRKNGKKGGNGARLWMSDTFNDDLEGYEDKTIAGKIDETIEEIIGMPFDVFSRIVLYSSSHASFFDLPTTSTTGASQVTIIEELFNITELSENADKLKKKNDELRKEIKILSDMDVQIQSEHSRYEDQMSTLTELSHRWESETNLKKKDLSKKLKLIQKIDFDKNKKLFESAEKIKSEITDLAKTLYEEERKLNDLQKEYNLFSKWVEQQQVEIEEIKERVDKSADIDFQEQKSLLGILSDIKVEVRDIELSTRSAKSNLIDLEKELEVVTKEINHLQSNTCPYCKQQFEDVKDKIDENRKLMTSLSKNKEELSTLVITNEEKLSVLSGQALEISEKLFFDDIGTLTKQEERLKNDKERLHKLISEENPHESVSEEQIKTQENKVLSIKSNMKKLEDEQRDIREHSDFDNERELIYLESQLESIIEDLEELKTSVNPHLVSIEKLSEMELPESKKSEIASLEDDLEHQDFLYRLLYRKDSYIRKALLAKNLTFLNQMLKYYLEKLGLPHKVSFNYDMSITISLFNNKIDHENLSKGQIARLNLALWAAFRKVREKRYGSIPFCMIDEALDSGLGNVGIQNAAKMIKNIAKDENISTFVISHKDEISTMFDSKLEIELHNKFSRIVRSDIGTHEKTLD